LWLNYYAESPDDKVIIGGYGAGVLQLTAIDGPSSPAAGDIYFDGTHFKGYNGTAWKQLDNLL
jgi:hypothetical protein